MEHEKAARRAALLATLRGTIAEDRTAWSAAIRSRLLHSEYWNDVRSVMVFAALKYEPDLIPLLELAGDKKLSFPALENDRIIPRQVQSADDLQISHGGIREPSAQSCPEIPSREIDLVLVPGLGFAADGTRLGRGRGHFDRFLAGLSAKALRCGVCFSCQLMPSLPCEPHDVRMDILLTEHGITPSRAAAGRVLPHQER